MKKQVAGGLMPNQFQTQSVEASEKTDAERRIEDVAVETTAAN